MRDPDGYLIYILVDASGIYARFLYSHFNNFGDRWVYSPAINSFITPTEGGPDGQMSFNSQIRRGRQADPDGILFACLFANFRMFLP
jgi:hypothetical protein